MLIVCRTKVILSHRKPGATRTQPTCRWKGSAWNTKIHNHAKAKNHYRTHQWYNVTQWIYWQITSTKCDAMRDERTTTYWTIAIFSVPDYSHDPNFFESNHDRLIRKWGGVKEFNAQKHRHTLKERGKAAGIAHFNLQRIASSTYLVSSFSAICDQNIFDYRKWSLVHWIKLQSFCIGTKI